MILYSRSKSFCMCRGEKSFISKHRKKMRILSQTYYVVHLPKQKLLTSILFTCKGQGFHYLISFYYHSIQAYNLFLFHLKYCLVKLQCSPVGGLWKTSKSCPNCENSHDFFLESNNSDINDNNNEIYNKSMPRASVRYETVKTFLWNS